MDVPTRAEVVENATVPHALSLSEDELYPSKEVREELRESIRQARNGEFASDEDVKAFFDKWGVYEG